MKELDNLKDSEEQRTSRFNPLRILLILILCLVLAAGAILAWKRLTFGKKEVKKETIQVPVAKKNPEPDLTFYKNLKEKDEVSGKKEKLVGLIPPSASPARPSEISTESALKKNVPNDPALSLRFTLQVASMKDHQKAMSLSDRLSRKGFPSYVISAEIPGKGVYYRVRIGHYVTKKGAEAVLEQLKQKGEKEAIIAKENVMTKTQ